MSNIIESTYEILQELGSGGGGVVYLARHLRLDKEVVLKVDKRRISTKPESLRREVDALKNLSHTHIPQVYDYILEDGNAYTVMDYIPGESLDRPLKRGEKFSQAQVICWARQLLDALVYLHSRPPHGILHADIKPANIMRTPDNQICLIDFNIALALGEEGAVRIGFSRGYASPEHYGLDYKDWGAASGDKTVREDTQCQPGDSTVRDSVQSMASSTGGRHATTLDVRSDIYSLGATLYHLFTGVHPAQNPLELSMEPLKQLSPAVAAIVQKAMMPNPDMRYQSAAEMLDAFEQLYQQDSRVLNLKRFRCVSLAVLSILFLLSAGTTFVGLKRMEQQQSIYTLAEYSRQALTEGDVERAVTLALDALPEQGLFTPDYTPQAQKALTDALGVYDLSDGLKAHSVITLPSEPMKLEISPDGVYLAAFYAYEVGIYEVATGELVVQRPGQSTAMSDVYFLDETKFVFAGVQGIEVYDLAEGRTVWTGKAATQIALSGDHSRIAAINMDSGQAEIYNTVDGTQIQTVDFEGKAQRVVANAILADPNDDVFALNEDGTMLAVSFAGGSLWLYDLDEPENDLILFEDSQYLKFDGGFYGNYFACAASGAEESLFVIVDVPNARQTGAFVDSQPFVPLVDERGIFLAHRDVLVQVEPETGSQTEVAYTQGAEISDFWKMNQYTLVNTHEQGVWLFDAAANYITTVQTEIPYQFVVGNGNFVLCGSINTPNVHVYSIETHDEAQVLHYDPTYQHDEARLSADGQRVMLFNFQQFRVYTLEGEICAEVKIPNATEVYDQQYRREGQDSYLEVIYNDGTVRCYSDQDGSLLSEKQEQLPDRTLYEEFFTDTLRITAPLHETPVAYRRESGKKIRDLEQDAFLTYVTQVENHVITEYISSEGERYGLLLDEDCQTLAKLPYLCDVVGDTLLFDYPSGNVRQCRLYSIDELLVLAREGG